jgi:gliding motility-associated-like protein
MAQPVANFTADKLSGCSPLTVTFTNTSTGSPTSCLWTFGNLNTSTSSAATVGATYITPGTYTVSLKVTNPSGTDTKTQVAFITVYPSPVANFSAVPQSGCAPLSVVFTDQTAGSAAITTWTWDFGNGNTGTTQNPTNLYPVPGTYPVTLAIKDANGCENVVTKPNYISVTPGFTIDFTSTTNIACTSPATVTFNATTSLPGTYTYNWNLGGSTTASGVSVSKTYTTPGNYDIELEVISANGCKQKIKKTAFVQIATLEAGFTYTTTSNCPPTNLFLTNTSSPNISSLVHWWQVNGANDRYSQNTNYQLTSKINVIRLIVSNAAGCQDTVTQTITLVDPPVAAFTVNQDVFCDYPAVVNFTDQSTGGPSTWSWNFGNSVGATTQNATTTYRAEGVFTARLVISKSGGCRDTAYHIITVAKPNVAIDRQHQKSGCVPYLAELKAIDNSVIPLTSWRWELNGNVVSTGKAFSYNINQRGTYIFKLTASNSVGCQFIDYDTVKVGMMPDFDFTVDKNVICYNPGNATFTYIKLDTVTADRIDWTIANGNTVLTASGTNPTVHFTDTGLFTVRVKASNNGCYKEITKIFYVKVNPPIAKFSFLTDTCKTDTVRFFDKSAGTANTYLWNFADTVGSVSTLKNPIHAYFTPGIYKVVLVVTDSVTGCRDTTLNPVTIIAPPKVLFTPSDTAVCIGSSITFKSTSIVDSTQKIISYIFARSDNTKIALNPVNFIFNTPGIYGMTLTIKDKNNCLFSYTDTSVVKVYNGKADFTLTPPNGCVPFVVLVKDTSKTENTIVSRKWVFSPTDSITTVLTQTTFAYIKPAVNQTTGNVVSMTVTDDKGCVFKASKTARNTKPVPAYTVTSTKACGRDSFTFNVVTSQQNVMAPASYSWSLPNNTTSTSGEIKLTLTGDTTYNVKMVITDGQGCKDSITKAVKVNTKAPKIGFDGTPRVIACYKTQPPPLVLFTDTSKAGGSPIVRRDWNLGNAMNIITKIGKDSNKVSTFYIKPGHYPVSLKITDSIGCSDSTTIPDFIVAGGPYGSYSFTPNRGCNPIMVDFTSVSPNAAAFVWDHADGNVDTVTAYTHSYNYTREGVFYPRLTMLDSTFKCDYGFDQIDSIVVLPLPKPDFTSDANVICRDGFITFTNQTATHPYPIPNWKWKFGMGDSALTRNPGTVQFPNIGEYTVSLEAVDSNGCYGIITKDSFISVVFDSIPPNIPIVKRATVVNNEEVLFEYLPNTEFDFGKYIIYSTTNQYLKADIQDTSLLETALNTLENPYAYKLQAMDVCRNISTMSEAHQTVELKASGAINSVSLNWTPYIGFDTSLLYEIWRTTNAENLFTQLITVPGTITNYTDTSVLCNQVYYYQIRSVETDSLLQFSWSDTAGAIPVYMPVLPTPQNIRATVVNNKYVLIEWHKVVHNRAFTFHIYRSTDSGAAVLYKKIDPTDTVFMDMDVDVQEHSYIYTTYVVDACGGQSAPSNIAQTVVLRIKMVGNDILKHDPKLTWNKYLQWDAGVDHYIADFYNDGAQEFQVIAYNKADNLETQHRYINLIQDEYCYKITAFQNGDTSIFSESNTRCISTEPRLYAPNVFTVNADNLNDLFFVRGIFIDAFSLKIYNRWGELVFETTNLFEGWDGTFDGKPCPSDVYVYTVEGVGTKGQRTELTGNVTLLR